MFLLICLLLAASALAQTPSNVRTCASELERLVTPRIQPQDCLLEIGDTVVIVADGEGGRGSVIVPDGTIVLPFVGKVQAANPTVSQLTANLNVLLSKYVNRPMVTVHFIENRKQPRYYVDGYVVQPGEYSLLAPVTVLEAIDKADGFRSAAHNHKISVVRGADAVLRLDYKGMLRHPERNVAIQNGDHVIVLQ